MASLSQVEANRDNSTLSTGPRTEAGKNIAAQNSTKHGLRGTRVVLANEDSNAYQALLDQLTEEHCPVGAVEAALVTEIAANTWRLERARNIEAEIFDRQLFSADIGDSATPLADAFSSASPELDKIRRYTVSIERAWYKALAELRKVQQVRADAEQARQSADEDSQQQLNDLFDQHFMAFVNAPMPDERRITPRRQSETQPESEQPGQELASFGNVPNPVLATPESAQN